MSHIVRRDEKNATYGCNCSSMNLYNHQGFLSPFGNSVNPVRRWFQRWRDGVTLGFFFFFVSSCLHNNVSRCFCQLSMVSWTTTTYVTSVFSCVVNKMPSTQLFSWQFKLILIFVSRFARHSRGERVICRSSRTCFTLLMVFCCTEHRT